MTRFDPYEHLLRNFSKHKFRLFLEETLLNPEVYSEDQLPDWGEVNRDNWDSLDLAHMNMPTRMGVLFFVTSYNRWIFQLDHVEDGLIRPDMLLDRSRRRVVELAGRLANEEAYVRDLGESLYDRIGHWVSDGEAFHDPVYGVAIMYYLTNLDLNLDEYYKVQDSVASRVRSIFLDGARKYGLDLDKARFGFGIGTPRSFLGGDSREASTTVIERIEARPDSLYLQFSEGTIHLVPANKRLFHIHNQRDPKIVMLDQEIDPRSYFVEEECAEFEFLLNSPNVSEGQLQQFLEAHPKFLLGTDYDELRPQISLVDESGRELRPDFFLRPLGKNLWDILDIKLPRVRLVVGRRNRERLSHYVHEGKSQLMNYSAFFENPRNRERIYRETGIDVFKPRLTLVIGKTGNVDEELWNRVIEQERPFVNIVGFDELLERARRLLIRPLA